MKAFCTDIIGLGNKIHVFDFVLDETFFKHYGHQIIQKGQLKAKVQLDKTETLIEAQFNITGQVELTCDRSLEMFEEGLEINKRVIFKYGNEEAELSDEISLITRETEQLDLGQYIYEFIILEVPMKKLHPKFRNEGAEDNEEGSIIFSSKSSEDEENGTDPRWEKLKKLK